MKRLATSALATAFLLTACGGSKTLTLPDQPIDRAATCGIVAAAQARVAMTDIKKPLPFEAQGKILHYATIAASDTGTFEPQTANSVSARMPALQAHVTEGKWQTLLPACAAAYPAAEIKDVTLPASRTDALLACDELAGFVTIALDGQNSIYGHQLYEYRQLKNTLDHSLVAGLRARAGSGLAAQQAERRKAMAKASALGSPVAVLDQCKAKFG
ncbi:MAG: hypothetical protein JWO25_1908 [Alphaproteobacteria bacterium]|nr:hypothetical protein [Alphaproteobacteria bacterium]